VKDTADQLQVAGRIRTLTGVSDGQSDSSRVHVPVTQSKDTRKNGDEGADKIAEVVQDSIGLP
jgi:hypothetical protein